MLLLLCLPAAYAMTECNSTCVAQYVNWTSFATTTYASINGSIMNGSYEFKPVTARLNTEPDNRLVKVTLAWDIYKNNGLPAINYSVLIDSLNDFNPPYYINTADCPHWSDGLAYCESYYELDKSGSENITFAENIFIHGSTKPFYADIAVNLYSPPDIISYVESLPNKGTVSAMIEGRKITNYLIQLKDMAWAILVHLYWLMLIMILLFIFRMVVAVVFYIYNKVRAEFK